MKWYRYLGKLSDADEEATTDLQIIQARTQLGTLRTIMAGGILTPERVARHRRQDVECMCACGNDKETVDRVSWQCTAYHEQRQDLFSRIECRSQDLPTCLRYAGLVPRTCELPDDSIKLIQQFLVFVWSTHIRKWHEGQDIDAQQQLQLPAFDEQNNTVHENGHVLLPRTTGPGVWCNRCGKYTSNLRHVRLKIAKIRCKQENGPELSSEVFLRSDNRLDALEHELNTRYNTAKHDLLWNRKLGKVANAPDEGLLRCLKCGRQWKWKQRITDLPRTRCVQTQQVKVLRRVNSTRRRRSRKPKVTC